MNELIELIFSDVDKTVDYYKNLYPERNLKEGAIVTRFAPSPTGFVHLGSLYTAFVSQKFAHDSNGIFYLRIEDTDTKRAIEGGIDGIIKDLNNFNIKIDESPIKGEYGPYIQSERTNIYRTFACDLVKKGLAYPCFYTEDELEKIREKQMSNKEQIGIYGKYRNILSMSDAIKRIKNGDKYVIRLKSQGDANKTIEVKDLVKGKLEFPENNLDVVILKEDGTPTYHFAHAVDDSLMHTTHVIRGDEWLSSLPIHVELFNVLGFKVPKYAHLSPIMIMDNGTKRKLSKRKDVEARVSYYYEQGIPSDALKLYFLTIANSNFEGWLNQNPNTSTDEFKLDFKKVSKDGALLDIDKLLNISKNYLSYLTTDEFYNLYKDYTLKYDKKVYNLITKHEDITKKFISIGRGVKKPRKDYSTFSEVKKSIWYMYDEVFLNTSFRYELNVPNMKDIGNLYLDKYYNEEDSQEEWFNKLKDMAEKLGYAREVSDYKENPDKYIGSIIDLSNIIRVIFTSKVNTPDLYSILKILGVESMKKRVEKL